jgi:hypothetical protein
MDINKNKTQVAKGAIQKIAKALNEELKQVTYVVMLPDSTDLHGDFTSADEVRKAKESFNNSLQRANLFHMAMTDTFDVIESYIAPADMVLNSQTVIKGTWLMTLQVKNDGLWEMIKQGKVNGISIGAMAEVEELADTE